MWNPQKHLNNGVYFYENYGHGCDGVAELICSNPNVAVLATHTSPSTSVGTQTSGSSISFNIGGNIGIAGLGGAIGLSGGVSWSESNSSTYSQVQISNLCNGIRAEWQYIIVDPKVESDYLSTSTARVKINDVTEAGRTNFDVINFWVWEIPVDNGDTSTQFGMKCHRVTRTARCEASETFWGATTLSYHYTHFNTPSIEQAIQLYIPKRD